MWFILILSFKLPEDDDELIDRILDSHTPNNFFPWLEACINIE